MKKFKADLHIHTCLSPCGDLEMSPRNIIWKAKDKGLDIIGITDHNSTRNVMTCFELGRKNNIFVVGGCEINTREEVHCLAFFPDFDTLELFQKFIDKFLPPIPNNKAIFGYPVAVDAYDNIIYKENKRLLWHIKANLNQLTLKNIEVTREMWFTGVPMSLNFSGFWTCIQMLNGGNQKNLVYHTFLP